ncbi:MAG: BamA/TamA family outer membrane protein [Oligoflexia bacterium]|nr:BamA/TamA family outer membrane protein [Oligoflexia bacterium]
MKFSFWVNILFLILVTQIAWAKPLGSLDIKGVDSKTTKAMAELARNILKENVTASSLQSALNSIVSNFQLNGAEIYIEDADNKTNVEFVITPIRNIRTVQFIGNSLMSTAELQSELRLSEGEGYSLDRLKVGLENLKKYYNLSGFIQADVSGQPKSIEGTNDIALVIQIKEGPPCLIQKIEFRSANESLNKAMSKKLKGAIGQRFSQNQLNQIGLLSQQYLLEDGYLSSKIEMNEPVYNGNKSGVTVAFVINEPYQYALVFEGNNEFTPVQLKTEMKLDIDNRLSTSPADDLSERINRFYLSKGFANVAIRYREVLYSQDFVKRITFSIKEGYRVRIRDFEIDGASVLSKKFYVNFLKENSGDLIGRGFYNANDLEEGIKKLVAELQNRGFIAAKAKGFRTDFDKTRELVKIQLTVEEGPQTIIEKQVFNGAKTVSISELEEATGLKTGAPLQLSLLEEASARIVEVYRNRGYLDAQVLNQGQSLIQYNAENTKATLNFQIQEGPLIIVESIAVEGNTFTEDEVILRELQFEPNEILTPEKISYSEERLLRLGLFYPVDIQVLGDDPQNGKRTIVVRVNEANPGIFKSGIGVSNDFEFSLKGYVGSAYRNLWGTGRSVNARAEVNYKVIYKFLENDLNFGYVEPYIFDTRNQLRVNLNRSRRLKSVENKQLNPNEVQKRVYAEDVSQLDLVLERDLTKHLKLLYEVYGIARINRFEISELDTSTALNIATIGPTLILDHRDNIFNPTKGSISTWAFEYANPYIGSTKTVHYLKTAFSHTKYLPIGPIVWANEGKAGYLKNLSELPDGAVPNSKAFYLGGRSTIRGFNSVSQSLPLPLEIPNGIRTDSHFYLIKSEVRFPIWGNLGGAVFYDGGAVRIPGEEGFVHSLDWRDSAGVGIRYNTPVGPLTLDYAQKIKKDPSRTAEGGFEIHFSIGSF